MVYKHNPSILIPTNVGIGYVYSMAELRFFYIVQLLSHLYTKRYRSSKGLPISTTKAILSKTEDKFYTRLSKREGRQYRISTQLWLNNKYPNTSRSAD